MSHFKYENPFTKRYVSITAIEKFSNISLEEMRYQYYLQSINSDSYTSEEKIVASNNDTAVILNDLKSEEPVIFQKNQINAMNIHNNQPMEVGRYKNISFIEPFVNNPNIEVMSNNPKRSYFSETEDTRVIKKIRLDLNVENENSDEENVINRSLKRDISFNENYDLLTASIGKKVKLNDFNGNSMSSVRKTKRKNTRVTNIDCNSEDKRILALIDELRKEGNVSVKEKNYEFAYDKYTSAISCSIRHSKMGSLCYSNRALCLQKMGRISEALDDCINAVLLDDKNWKAQLRKIKCLIDLNRYLEAEKEAILFNSIWKIEEGRQLLNVVTSAVRLSKLKEKADKLVATQQIDEALKCYNEAIDIDSGDAKLLGKRASVLYLMARYNEALIDVDDSLALDPNDESVCRTRIECLVKLERFHEASNDANRLNNLIPSPDNEKLFLWSQAMEKQANNRNYYQILGVTSSASLSEIKKRYRKLTLLYHPDKLVNCETEAKIIQEDKFKHLTKIYTVLSDPVSRRMYDIGLRCRY